VDNSIHEAAEPRQALSLNRAALWIEVIAIILIVAVAAFFRFDHIGRIPPGLNPDEATHALDALEVLQGQITIYSPDEGSTGALWRYLLALNFALFGSSILSLRAFAGGIGVVSAGMAYLVVREISLAPVTGRPGQEQHFLSNLAWRESIAGIAALLLAVSYWHVDLSRTAFSAILMLLVQDATFFCLWRALRSGRKRWFVLLGLGLGLLVYNYLPAKLVPAVLLLFLLLQWIIARRNALVAKHGRPLAMAGGIALLVALPFILFALLHYQELVARAAIPTAAAVSAGSPWQAIIGNLAVFGLWPTPWLAGRWNSFFLGPILTFAFVIGVGVSLWRMRRPNYLFLLVWWLVMLLPGALAPEGAIPHVRRSIGSATATFALASLGLATLVSALISLVQAAQSALTHTSGKTGSRAELGSIMLTLAVGLGLVVQSGANTFWRYFVQWGPSEAARLAYHMYDLELADLMARQAGAETVYLLPLDSSAGIVNPLLDSITFVYRGQAAYDFLPDDERTMAANLARLTANRQTVRLLRWKVTKHTGADPKGVAHYYLEKWGRRVGTESYTYFDMDIYQLEGMPTSAFTPAVLTPTLVSYEEKMALTGFRFGDASDLAVDELTARAGGLLWAELAWRKTGESSENYQVAMWVEDEAGHVVGKVDKPLLNNVWHQGTGQWSVGAEERDYYLVPIDPATLPGTYRLKVVVYAGEGDNRRLAPHLPDIGADLAFSLGKVTILPSASPPDPATLSIPQPLNLEIGNGLRLLGLDPGFAGPLRPGDQATLKLWWQAQEAPARDMALIIGMDQGDQAWPLSALQPLGGPDYPTHVWPAGAVVQTFVDVRIPPAVASGDYDLALRLVDVDQEAQLGEWLWGQMQIEGRPRHFEIPPLSHPLKADFDQKIKLLGYDLDVSQVAVSGSARLTLYWQAQAEMPTVYKVFVHLLDASGQIVTQVDREPQAGLAPTTGWLPGEVLIDNIEVPATQRIAGTRTIAIGLYDPASGKRLPVLDENGATLGDSVTLSIP
jgi:hypothetical protein